MQHGYQSGPCRGQVAVRRRCRREGHVAAAAAGGGIPRVEGARVGGRGGTCGYPSGRRQVGPW